MARTLWRRTTVYFYYTARPRLLNPLSHRRRGYERRALAQVRARPTLLQTIEHVRRRTASTGCDYGDYWALYETVRSLQPACVLECGSGISSAVIALAVKDVSEATGSLPRFISLEEDPSYHEQICRAMPQDLAPLVDIRLSKREEAPYGPYLGCRYRDVPDLPYDFVFIDGPTLRSSPGAPKCFNADLVEVASRCRGPVEALLDQRIGTYWVLRELLPQARFKYDPTRRLTRIQIPAAPRPSMERE